MRRFMLSTVVAAALAVAAPGVAAARTPTAGGTAIPVPHPITTPIDGVPMVELYDGGGGLPYLGVSHPYNAGDWEPSLVEFHDSGVYDAELARIDAIADRWVRHEAHGRGKKVGHGHAHGKHAHGARHGSHHGEHAKGGRRPALVLDIDETSLSNYSAIKADNFTFGPASQAEATDEIGQAIGPTLALFNDAKRAGVAVFFVTGRPEAQRAVTVENLEKEGYDGWQQLYLKPPAPTMTTVQYKSGARRDIESQGYRIIANVGDQYSDLAGGHAARAFKLANPFYFLP
jgi:phosphoglycolate phosphatase-like HAD superfamily hydrolase